MSSATCWLVLVFLLLVSEILRYLTLSLGLVSLPLEPSQPFWWSQMAGLHPVFPLSGLPLCGYSPCSFSIRPLLGTRVASKSWRAGVRLWGTQLRSEEHTSELQSR